MLQLTLLHAAQLAAAWVILHLVSVMLSVEILGLVAMIKLISVPVSKEIAH